MINISLKNISLTFPNTYGTMKSLRGELFEYIKGNLKFDYVSSLQNIDLSFENGDRIGLLGPNGSGKSSLLRVISGIYVPTQGEVDVKGDVLSLISLTSGIDTEATGIENIYSCSYMRNYTSDQIDRKLKDIVDFSELGPSIYRPVRTYSSGMMMRLSASILVNFDCDILILDEFISTGDANFKKKLQKKISEKIDKSKIFIFASHDELMVNKLCNKKIYLENGKVIDIQDNTLDKKV